jgi:hypothetical protein
MMVQIPEVQHGMNATFDACFKASAQLVNSTCFFGFAASDKKKSFGDCLPPSFTNAQWANSRALVQSNELPSHCVNSPRVAGSF